MLALVVTKTVTGPGLCAGVVTKMRVVAATVTLVAGELANVTFVTQIGQGPL